MVYYLDYGGRKGRRVKNNPDEMKNSKKFLCFGIVLLMFLYLREFLPYIHIEFRRESVLEKSKSLSREAHRGIKVCFRSAIYFIAYAGGRSQFFTRKKSIFRQTIIS